MTRFYPHRRPRRPVPARAAVTRGLVRPPILALLTALAVLAAGCSDDPALTCDPAGGAVAGDADTHCGTKVVVLAPSMCEADDDGGPPAVAARNNAEGEDDDCKYHVSWTASPICFGATVEVELTVSARFDNAPQVGAAPRIEAHLVDDVNHVLPETGQRTVELGGGRYRIGPIRFNASGQWEMTFQLYEECNHTESSPRGSVTFLVDVP